jgi:hypothetical protein
MIRKIGKDQTFSLPFVALVYATIAHATNNTSISALVCGVTCELKIVSYYLCY